MDYPAKLEAYKEMFRHDPEGFEALRELAPEASIETKEATNGSKIIYVEGRKLHSGRDPELEAKRFARNQNMQDVDVALLLGYASGYVARALRKRNQQTLFVYEPSLSVLREGLFHGPADGSIQIITTIDKLEDALDAQIKDGASLRVCSWPASARIFDTHFECAIATTAYVVNRAQRLFNTVHYRSGGWLQNYLTNLPNLARRPNDSFYIKQFTENPAIICSAGPSLNSNAELLKSLQGHCLIIAVNTAARALASMGIKPHAVVCVESLDVSVQFRDIPWLNEVTAFLELTGNPNNFGLGFRDIVPIAVATSSSAYFSERLQPGISFGSGNCVANAAVAIAGRLGCPGMVLIGQDLAYKDDLVYAKGTMFEEMRVDFNEERTTHRNLDSKKEIEGRSEGILSKNITASQSFAPLTLPAWNNPKVRVQSNESFACFRDWFVNAATFLKKRDVWLVNATEGGAHIPGWDEIPLQSAIQKYGLDKKPSSPDQSVEQKLLRLAKSPPIGVDKIIGELEKERESMMRVLRSALSSRGWVNSDPDGDVLAQGETSQRIAEVYLELKEQLGRSPLILEKITEPLNVLVQRQQINTFSLSKILEDQIQELNEQIDSTIDSLRQIVPHERAAS